MTPAELKNLRIEEVSGVDFPASLLDGWLLLKARARKDAPEGITMIDIPGEAMDGWYAVADSWVEKLRADGGDAAVEAHFNEIFSKLGGIPATKHSTAPVDAPAGFSSFPAGAPSAAEKSAAHQMRDERGRWRASVFRRADPRGVKLTGAALFR